MDIANRFHTPTTHALERIDYLVVAALITGYLVAEWSEVNWLAFWGLFWVIDVVGTFPALFVYYRRHRSDAGGPTLIAPGFHVLYNVTHSFAVGTAVALVVALAAGEAEPFLLAIPLHLTLDRSIFGNVYKPFGVSFQPDKDERFARFEGGFALAAGGTPDEPETVRERMEEPA